MSNLYLTPPQLEMPPIDPLLEAQQLPAQQCLEMVDIPIFDANKSYYQDFTTPTQIDIALEPPRTSSISSSSACSTNSSTEKSSASKPCTILETAFPTNSIPMAQDNSPSMMTTDLSHLGHILRDRQSDIANLVPLYFETIHFLWPILHHPTFDPQKVPQILLASIVVNMSWMTKVDWHKSIANATTRVFSQILTQSMVSILFAAISCTRISH
jgi:hypothetical protein